MMNNELVRLAKQLPRFLVRHSSLLSRRFALLTASLFLVLFQTSFGGPATTASLRMPVDLGRVERLRSHGLSPVPAILAHFLEQGFAPGTNLGDLPSSPALKTQIIVDAIVECARQQVRQAAPTLGRLAFGLPSVGVRAIVQWDMQQQRAGAGAAFETTTLHTLRLNAIVALGLIGDQDRNYELMTVFDREKDPGIKIACALAMATLGSRAGLSYLVGEVGRKNRTTSVAAAQALKLVTGFDYGPAADDPVVRREVAAKDWKNWLKQAGKAFRPDRNQILARRLTPPVRPNLREPRTVRELIDCIAYPDDPRWTVDPYDAYERLRLMGEAVLEGLEAILADRSENLRVRRQAIIIYAQTATVAFGSRPSATRQPDRAYKTLRRLRWDRNPEIREVVREWLPRVRGAK